MDKQQVLVTYSMMRMFCECKKLFKYRYVDELAPVTIDNNLFFGSIIHTCLEKYYKDCGGFPAERKTSGINAYIIESVPSQVDKMKALAMVDSYIDNYPHDSEEMKVLELEKAFVGKINKNVSLAGKIDGIIEKDGSYLIFEHKTTSMLNDSYMARLDNDFQILVYSYCAKELLGLDKPITGVLYNILSKSKLKKKKTEEYGEFYIRIMEQYKNNEMFKRRTININETKMQAVLSDINMISDNILQTLETGEFYRNNSHCYRWNKPCAYYNLCYCAEKDKEAIKIELFDKTKPYVELMGDITSSKYLLPSDVMARNVETPRLSSRPNNRQTHKLEELADQLFNLRTYTQSTL